MASLSTFPLDDSTMEIQEQLKGIRPLKGHLLPLRTVQETRPVEETGEALVAEIDIKSADKVVKLLSAKYPRDPALSIAHLRRFAKPKELPGYLKHKFPQWAALEGRALYILIPPRLPELSELETLLLPFAPVSAAPAPTSKCPSDGANETSTINIESAEIPLLPPTSQEQTQKWCKSLWLTHYNPSARPASHCPPPMLLTQIKASVEPQAGIYLSIAKYVAREAQNSSRGRNVGVVIVDPAIASNNIDNPLAAIVAVAGDARYYYYDNERDSAEVDVKTSSPDQLKPYNPDNEGRPDHHALMRGVSMVSHKRVCSSSASASPSLSPLVPPPSPLESHFVSTSKLLPSSSGGYLCTSLDIYSTHEPCICCAMGMLLSRFRTVIIPSKRRGRNRADAALGAEVGYGLHWREELNWRAVGFEFVEEENEEADDEREGNEFHA